MVLEVTPETPLSGDYLMEGDTGGQVVWDVGNVVS